VNYFYRKGSENVAFIGEYEHSLDSKGRVIMPAKYREALGDIFYITRGLDQNLLVFGKDEWNTFYEKLKTLPMSVKNARGFSRWFLSGAVECEANAQGRVLLPAHLRQHAKIDKDVVIVGNGDRIELWNKDLWAEYLAGLEPDDMSEGLNQVGYGI
jgi:MraZ protein